MHSKYSIFRKYQRHFNTAIHVAFLSEKQTGILIQVERDYGKKEVGD